MPIKTEIHVWDLPLDWVYIKLNTAFSSALFEKARLKFSSYSRLGTFLGVKRGDTTIAENWRRGKGCYPLYKIIALGNHLDISLPELEANICEIKTKTALNKRGGNSGKSIFNPKLPIVINEDFAELVGHLCGDGHVSRSNPKKGQVLTYTNSEPALIHRFRNLIKNIFGEIEPNIITRTGKGYLRPNYCLQYPSIISEFVIAIFDIRPNDNKRVPTFLFSLSNEAKARFLQAMFDDEGSVLIGKKRKIQIGLRPRHQIEIVQQLLGDFRIKTGNILKCKSPYHRIEIAEQDSVKRFRELIGFVHPQKITRLEYIIKKGWKFKRYDNNLANTKILTFLEKNGPADAASLALSLNRHKSTVREHLNELEQEGKIVANKAERKINKITRYYYLWGVRNELQS